VKLSLLYITSSLFTNFKINNSLLFSVHVIAKQHQYFSHREFKKFQTWLPSSKDTCLVCNIPDLTQNCIHTFLITEFDHKKRQIFIQKTSTFKNWIHIMISNFLLIFWTSRNVLMPIVFLGGHIYNCSTEWTKTWHLDP
jgi:hypothetical protein